MQSASWLNTCTSTSIHGATRNYLLLSSRASKHHKSLCRLFLDGQRNKFLLFTQQIMCLSRHCKKEEKNLSQHRQFLNERCTMSRTDMEQHQDIHSYHEQITNIANAINMWSSDEENLPKDWPSTVHATFTKWKQIQQHHKQLSAQ